MARIKIDYGIDLGTTNSAICRMEKGVPVVKKIEVTDETMPSCVFFNRRGGVVVGASAYRSMKSDKKRTTKTWKVENSNTFVDFKRTMGTDEVYHSENMKKIGLKADYSSEELSAEVLKQLKAFITDETIHSIVITVPAKFSAPQKAATKRAAQLAGYEHCVLLQEPVAASMAYGLSSEEKNGYWMVFDFGGGTFDAALLKVEDGIMQVFDTEGDNYLGGKNLDYAIVDEIIIPYLKQNFVIDEILAVEERKKVLRDAMKTYAEEAKNHLSFQEQEDIISNLGDLGEDDEGEELEISMTITQEQAFNAMRPLFQKAIDICKSLLERNNMRGSQLDKIILVGGPTNSPLIRQMLRDQISVNVDTSIDPMTAVAKGAALYASTIDADVNEEELEVGTIRLDINYESTTVENSLYIPVLLNKDASGANCPDKVFVQFVGSDQTWSSGKVEIDTNGNVIETNLKEGKVNSFIVEAYDILGNKLECFPNEISIIQGTKTQSAPLPYFITIEVWDAMRKKLVCAKIEGLEKNKPIPAVGILNGYKTTSQLRPGNSSDKLVIPVYQTDSIEVGISSKLYEHVADVVIDGSEVDALIPEGTEIDLTIKVDSSEMMTLEALFTTTEQSISKELKTNVQTLEVAAKDIEDNFIEAERTINRLAKAGVNVAEVKEKLEKVRTENDNNSETKMILQHQKEVMREIEQLEQSSEFERVEKELKRLFAMTEEDQRKYGTFETGQILEQLRKIVDEAIANKDAKMARDVMKQVRSFDYKLALIEYYVAWVHDWNRNFDRLAWKDKNRARQLINKALVIINDAPTVDKLDPYIDQLIDLLPASAVPASAQGRLTR